MILSSLNIPYLLNDTVKNEITHNTEFYIRTLQESHKYIYGR